MPATSRACAKRQPSSRRRSDNFRDPAQLGPGQHRPSTAQPSGMPSPTADLPVTKPWGIEPRSFAGVFFVLEERLFARDPHELDRCAARYAAAWSRRRPYEVIPEWFAPPRAA